MPGSNYFSVLLGGETWCWQPPQSFAVCCDQHVWPQSNPWCQLLGASCCEPADRCPVHLLAPEDPTAHLVARAMTLFSCWDPSLLVAVNRALDMRDPERMLGLIAQEWSLAREITLDHAVNAVLNLAPEFVPAELPVNHDCCNMIETLRCPCATTPHGKALRACADQPRDYPRIRGMWYNYGLDGTTRAGRTLWCLCRELQSALDLFAASGSGAALTIAHAMQHGRLVTVERDPVAAQQARENLAGYKHVELLEEDAVEIVPQRCDVDLIVFDPDDPNDLEPLFNVLWQCTPKYWLLNNVQFEDHTAPLMRSLIQHKNYSVLLHDFSPTLVPGFSAFEEFVVLHRNSVPNLLAHDMD